MTMRAGGPEGGSAMTAPMLREALLKALDVVEMEDAGGLARWTIECCTTVLGPGAAGLVELADAQDHGDWTLTTSHDGLRPIVEDDLDGSGGPVHECMSSGHIVTLDDLSDLSDAEARWTGFAESARQAQFTWLHVRPLRNSDVIVGALLLLGSSTDGRPAYDDLELLHALAALAVAAGAQRRQTRLLDMEVQQLQTALETRIVIEQAKGILAVRHGITLDRAFRLLRRHARDHRKGIHAVAYDVVHSRGLLDSTERKR